MKAARILTMLFLPSCLILWAGQFAIAGPAGTAFTYQGRLIDANEVADGLYDFQFKLFNDEAAGSQLSGDFNTPDVDVIDGYFTVELDFGSVFDGNERWLEIGVRPSDQNDPCAYTLLTPRQEITPTPYALRALTGGSGSDSLWQVNGTSIYYNNGNVGIGTTGPDGKLDIYGAASPTTNLVLAADYENKFRWRMKTVDRGNAIDLDFTSSDAGDVEEPVLQLTRSTSTRPEFAVLTDDLVVNNGNVGIGTTGPGSILQVAAISDTAGQGIRIGNASTPWGAMRSAITGVGAIVFDTWSGSAWNSGVMALTTVGNVGIGTTTPDAKLTVNEGTIKATNSLAYGKSVYGEASNSGDYENYGGCFTAAGGTGRGVLGLASNSGYYTNYGGFFEAKGANGRGVYGEANNSGNSENYGGYFWAAGTYGRGVYGSAAGLYGRGVSGSATFGTGVYGKSIGYYGEGVLGYAEGTAGTGVVGYGAIAGTSYDFDATGPGVNYGATSSIRWKKDIKAIDEPLEKVMQLRGVYFNWDLNHGGHHDLGMIAEEVGKVLPEIVVYEENGIDASGMDYSKTTPLLVEAIKALKMENDELKRRLEVLETAIGKSNEGGEK